MNNRPASWSDMKMIITKVLQVILNRFQKKSIVVRNEDHSHSSAADSIKSLPIKEMQVNIP